MTSTVEGVTPAPTLEQELRGTLLLFGMFGLAFLLLAVGIGAMALLQSLVA